MNIKNFENTAKILTKVYSSNEYWLAPWAKNCNPGVTTQHKWKGLGKTSAGHRAGTRPMPSTRFSEYFNEEQ